VIGKKKLGLMQKGVGRKLTSGNSGGPAFALTALPASSRNLELRLRRGQG